MPRLNPFLPLFVLLLCPTGADSAVLRVQPDRVELTGQDPLHGVLVTLTGEDGKMTDITKKAQFTSAAPETVSVDSAGMIGARADGQTELLIRAEGQEARVPVIVSGMGRKTQPSFRQDVLPVLTKTGCNMGGCHGKLAGQNGFRLSLRGYAADWDYEWLTRELNGRRVDFAFPESSLILTKPCGDLPHEGGVRFKPGSRAWQLLHDWISARAPEPLAGEADAESLEVLPGDRLMAPGESQQLLVRARWPGGRVRDVTWLAQFFSNDETTLAVKPSGLVKALRCGEGGVRVHFQGLVRVISFTMPFPHTVPAEAYAARQNVLDEPVFRKLQLLHLPPAELCTDTAFLRRAFLDAAGILPSPEEVRAFVGDGSPDKRSRAVDALLNRPEFTDFWTLQLADLLQNRKERDHDVRGQKGVRQFHAWLRRQVAANRPWHEIARDVLLSQGDVNGNPQAGYFVTVAGEKDRVEESELPDSVAQSFLGTRIGCARCHNHPLERYTQDDFYHFAACFSRVNLDRHQPETGATVLQTVTREEKEQRKRVAEAAKKLADTAASAVSGEERQKQMAERQRELDEQNKRLEEMRTRTPGVSQPRTGKFMEPRALDRAAFTIEPGADPRVPLVNWMLGSEYFSGAMVNRLWHHFFSVGLVEPVDDLRASNPPSNAELWAVLNREFRGAQFDIRHVIRLILNSRAYQLASATVPENETDSRFYSHYFARRLPAEVILDAIAGATGVPSRFPGYPEGIRAAQLAEPGADSYFLTLFGRSDRVTACACERKGEVTLPQMLHLKNSEELQQRIADEQGRLKELLKGSDDAAVTDAVFLSTVSRLPLESEKAAVNQLLAAGPREGVFADLFWALLNSKEFSFNH